jgi:hypothetical protein
VDRQARRPSPVDPRAVPVLDAVPAGTMKARLALPNLTVVRLPAYNPKLDRAERLWLHLRERFPSLHFPTDADATTEAAIGPGNRLCVGLFVDI